MSTTVRSTATSSGSGRSSSRRTTSSRRSRRSTEWDIATATDDPRARAGHDRDDSASSAEPRETPSRRAQRLRRRLSPLTRRILAVNVAALALLGLGLLYLGGSHTSLINAQLHALPHQGETFAAAPPAGAGVEEPVG